MSKIGTIARYELLMAWRRGSLPILWLVLVLSSLAFSVLTAAQARSGSILYVDPATRAAADASGWTVEAIMRTTQQVSQVGLITGIFTVALVLIVAEAIPLDRQFRIHELLDALPISRAGYLGGKVISVLGGVTLIVALGGAVSLVTARLILGEYDLRVVSLAWLVLTLPICWANGAVSVLTAAFWRTRRTAVLFSLLLMPVFMALLWVALMHLSFVSGLIQPVYIRNVTSLADGESPMVEIIVRLMMGLMLLAGVTLLVWMVVWALLRFQDAR
ncbi:MAG: hypothetical protein IT319_02485 [Anaerolineae bacterium]|nr:hypothetical protein [Anaerolineae bacterium]